MTLEEAIKILATVDSRDITPASQDFRTAIKLGNEAFEAIEAIRVVFHDKILMQLPSETKD